MPRKVFDADKANAYFDSLMMELESAEMKAKSVVDNIPDISDELKAKITLKLTKEYSESVQIKLDALAPCMCDGVIGDAEEVGINGEY